ncbi:MAG: dTMP kinase [Microbacteriaceae bacterium]|nr:dTMP kinase [Microbacteriaceae bacterium]
MSTGIFITLEGGDGVGKTTQAELLSSWLEQRGFEVVRTREPGGTDLGASIRGLLLHGGHVTQRAEALLYAADRAQHIDQVVRPALERGAAVVQDRFIDSSLAYQGAGRALALDEVRGINEWATERLWPELTVLLDLDPTVAAKRRAEAGMTDDRLEREAIEFHERVREEFRALAAAEPGRFLVLDAAARVEDLHEAIIARVAPLVTEL